MSTLIGTSQLGLAMIKMPMIKRNNKIIARKGLGMTIEKWLKEEKMRLGGKIAPN